MAATTGLTPQIAAAALRQPLKANEKLKVSVDNGQLVAEKTGPDTFQKTGGVLGRLVAGTADAVNGGVGTDPTFSALTSFQALYTAISNMSLVPQTAVQFFGNHFFPAFRLAAPLMDGAKLANTWKLNRAQHKAEPAPTPAEKKHPIQQFLKSGGLGTLVAEGAKVALDGVVAVAVVGALLNLPALALMSLPVALGVGLAGDITMGVLHGVQTGTELSDRANGATFGQRVQHFMQTNSATALFRRVFKGEEPLQDKPDGTPDPPPESKAE